MLAVALTGTGSAQAEMAPASPASAARTAAAHATVDSATRTRMQRDGKADAIVTYRAARVRQPVIEQVRRQHGGLTTKDGRRAYPRLTTAAYGKLKKETLDRIGHGVAVLRDYDTLPIQYLRIPSPKALEALLADPDVASIRAETVSRPQLTQSRVLVHQPEVAAQGYTGADTSVAVLDTGVDFTKAAFGSCKTAGGSCKVVYAADIAPDDRKRDAGGHGTNVAGIVLGMAPSTKIVALDVIGKSGTASSPDILAAVNWVISHQEEYRISAMNLSLGDGEHHTQECIDSELTAAFAEAATVGVFPVASTGNSAYVNGAYQSGVGWPACTPGTIRVGAVYDSNIGSYTTPGGRKNPNHCTDGSTAADEITCFSQGGSLVSVLAPGAKITAAGLEMSGTSQAAPHVAGAVAVFRSAFPEATNGQLSYALGHGGPGLIDGREGTIDDPPPGGFLIFNRLDLLGGLDALRALMEPRRVVGNGTIELGVNQFGDLNAADGTHGVTGLRYLPTNADALTPGCLCEGWGIGDPVSGIAGFANESAGVSSTLSLLDYTATETRAVSKVQVGSLLQVTHDYHPSPNPNLYEVTVTVRNISADPVPDLRYRRVMDWDVDPTTFNEYVTLRAGSSPSVTYVSDDGFASANPLDPQSSILAVGDVVDSGPADHGALFDLSLGALAPDATLTFKLYYGAAGTEAAALAALAEVGVDAYSLGQPSEPYDPAIGAPNTFVFGYRP